MIQATAHRYVVTNDQFLGGEPIIEGTRTPVWAIVELLPRQQRRSYTNPKRERGIRCVSLAGASG